ncbi:MAG: hypothetical protein JWM10_5243 [Myxococcaceae bacterium]|nr:hypothetical protein [Myxococcaceae bacterium]
MADTAPDHPHRHPDDARAPRASRVALAVYLVAVVVYALFAGDRLRSHSPDNHFAYLADSFNHGTLAVRCAADDARHVACPPGGGGNDWARYNGRWFVAFPAFPAVVYMLPVAVLGRDFPNRAFDVLLAGLAPALLYAFLDLLRRRGYSRRSWKENLGLTALFAFGSVYFFTAVQGAVWFSAHVVGAALGAAYLLYALDAASPFAAGALLGLSYHTRTSTLLAAVFFGLEAIRAHRRADEPDASADDDLLTRFARYARHTDWRAVVGKVVRFSIPVLVAIVVYAVLNKLRFDDWRETGYRHLQIRWQARILRWGLVNFHYLSRNLAVALALLPWISRVAPYVQVSRHGLALWVTTPQYLELLRPARTTRLATNLVVAALAVAAFDLMYQNSGWVQFGFRFSNDFALLLIGALAVNGRPWRRLGWALLVVAIGVNAFGAATFERAGNVYQGDNTAEGMFQPD